MSLSDTVIIESLINKDEKVTHDFFFVWCRPLFYSLIRRVFNYEVDYDELVNELYVHLMENDAKRLRSFRGRSSVYQWLKCVAIRFFIAKRKQAIEEKARGSLYEKDEPSYDPHEIEEIRNDILALLDRLQNDRYRYVLKQHFILGVDYEEIAAALRTSPANVYNIKKRAITKLAVIVLDDIGYEKH